jgi:hypothetical protein
MRLGDQYVKRLSEELWKSCPDELARILSGSPDPTSALFVGYVEDQPRWWVWVLGSEPERKKYPQCLYCVHTGEPLSSAASTLEQAQEGLRCYIEYCKERSDKYGGAPQILTVALPPDRASAGRESPFGPGRQQPG